MSCADKFISKLDRLVDSFHLGPIVFIRFRLYLFTPSEPEQGLGEKYVIIENPVKETTLN